MDEHVHVPAGIARILAQQPGLIGLVDGGLQMLGLAHELAADVDVGGMGVHGEAGHQAALDQLVRVEAHDLAILAGAGLAFVGVHHQIMRPVAFLGHEGPLHAGGEAGAATAAQARGLHLVDDPVAALFQDRLGVVPVAARAGTGQAPVLQAVQVGEDAVLITQHHASPFRVVGPPSGAEN